MLVLSVVFLIYICLCFIECILSRHQGLKLTKLGLLGVPVPRCDEYGDYDTVQCRKVMCWCADIHTGKALGEAVPGTPNCHTIVS